jgi:iron complex transport system substrate-binding protein
LLLDDTGRGRFCGRSGILPLVALLLVAISGGCDPADDGSAGMASAEVDAFSLAAGQGEPVEAVDDAGRTIRLAEPARRIVSLMPAATETVIALGAESLLVGRTDYDDAALAHLPSVGGGLTPSVELLVSLRPDLVIAWEEAGAARIRPRLEALGIAVFAVATRDTAGIFANVERFGRLTGESGRAERLAAEMRRELAAVSASVAGREPPAVLYMIGLDPPMVAGPNLFIGEIVEVAGGRNIFADATAPSPQISLEEIVRRQPEIVLIPAAGASSISIERLASTPGWRELIESGETRFHALPPDVLHRPGPSVVAAARLLRDVIHPEMAVSP